MGKKSRRKSIRSLRKRIEEHRRKIATELARSFRDQRIIQYWRKEIENFEKRIAHIERQLGNKEMTEVV
ncbi:MAG TPA: hypothetical protein EYP49_01295 [Anaerolineae bacterium]|nr:hypothetical protein [Anaerolineae bacterium]